jgi:hypothetical protein
LAILDRCSALILAARAFPPFIPPSLPRATAAGFFSSAGEAGAVALGEGNSCPVLNATMWAASWFGSRGSLLERLGIPHRATPANRLPEICNRLRIQSVPVPKIGGARSVVPWISRHDGACPSSKLGLISGSLTDGRAQKLRQGSQVEPIAAPRDVAIGAHEIERLPGRRGRAIRAPAPGFCRKGGCALRCGRATPPPANRSARRRR